MPTRTCRCIVASVVLGTTRSRLPSASKIFPVTQLEDLSCEGPATARQLKFFRIEVLLLESRFSSPSWRAVLARDLDGGSKDDSNAVEAFFSETANVPDRL